MASFVEVKGIIINVDDVAWVEYMTASEIDRRAEGTSLYPPVEPEGRTWVELKSSNAAHWIPGDVRAELRVLLGLQSERR